MGVADQQIIAGQQYTMYTPAWYAAREAEQARQANLSAKTAADAKVTALNEITPALKGLMGGFGVTTSTGAMAPGVAGTGAQPYVPPGATGTGTGTGTAGTGVATTPGNDAMYAAAKDKIGNQMRSSLMALRDSASEGGQFAAGGQNPALQSATERLISRGQGEMGDVARQQAAAEAAAAKEEEKMRLAAQLGLTNSETMAGVNNSYDLQQLQAKNAADMQRQLLSSLFGLFGSGGLY